jgi:glycosyltransferase involved in cell wall biosynthesis
MSTLHLVVPDGVRDPTRPSGGNVYDRRLAEELSRSGWTVVEHPITGRWPGSEPAAADRLAAAVATIPDGATVLVDGLVASASGSVLVPAAQRLALGVLVHLPLGVGAPEARTGEREVLLAARAVIATSAWTREWLLRTYGLPRVDVAAPGVVPAPVAPGSDGGGALLCVGRASVAKGHDVLTAALGSLGDLDWTCTWVGPVEVADAEPTGRTRLTGPLPAEAVAGHYRTADLLVLPSRFETYGMVLTEALAHGVPVLAGDVGGVREAVGVTADGEVPGLLVPPGDVTALTDALRRWLTDRALRRRLRAAALERRATLTGWDRTAERVAAALPVPWEARR